MQYTFFYCEGHLKHFLKTISFVKNLEITHIVEGRGSGYLRHYDALLTKIDILLTP